MQPPAQAEPALSSDQAAQNCVLWGPGSLQGWCCTASLENCATLSSPSGKGLLTSSLNLSSFNSYLPPFQLLSLVPPPRNTVKSLAPAPWPHSTGVGGCCKHPQSHLNVLLSCPFKTRGLQVFCVRNIFLTPSSSYFFL